MWVIFVTEPISIFTVRPTNLNTTLQMWEKCSKHLHFSYTFFSRYLEQPSKHLKKFVKPMKVKLRIKMSHWPKIPHRYAGPPKLLTFWCHTHYCFMRKSTEHSWFRQKMSLYRILSLNILVLFSKINNGLLKIVTRFNVTKWKLHCTRILWRFKEGDTK